MKVAKVVFIEESERKKMTVDQITSADMFPAQKSDQTARHSVICRQQHSKSYMY